MHKVMTRGKKELHYYPPLKSIMLHEINGLLYGHPFGLADNAIRNQTIDVFFGVTNLRKYSWATRADAFSRTG
jgi:hypothetical protein